MSELVIKDKLIYLIADQDFYENLSSYRTQERDFKEALERNLPEGWELTRRSLWWDCSPQEVVLPDHGWKIHLSATPAHAPAILMTAARVMFESNVPFKFVVDRTLLMMMNGKRWDRGTAGKFITIYPKDTNQCAQLLEKLYASMIGYWGPYILSDRRYRDSRIVHYRYGGILPTKRTDIDGRAVYVVSDGKGGYRDDERSPHFALPADVVDPFQGVVGSSGDIAEAGCLKDGRYKIEAALSYSNAGNVYLAEDRHLSRKVVIKEARPYTNISVRGLDAIQLLKKEWRILQMIESEGIAPRPLDFFFDWEHAYLVEEYLGNAITLREYFARISIALRTRANNAENREFYTKYRHIAVELVSLVKRLHNLNIIFSDLSIENVMVSNHGGDGRVDLRLIDFEGAYESGVDIPTHLFTPGFSPSDFESRGMATPEDDYYALGALMLAGLFPVNGMLLVNPRGYEKYLSSFSIDFDVPECVVKSIRRLLSSDADVRLCPEEVGSTWPVDYPSCTPSMTTLEVDSIDLGNVIARILSFIDANADFQRRDRLYPADPCVFETNPLSIAHGACGIAYVMHRIRGRAEDKVLDWILSHQVRADAYSPGLYGGLSGVAWSLSEMGLVEDALAILKSTDDHHLLWRSADVFNGVSGWGMTQLHFHRKTGDAAHLANAIRGGAVLN
ncbi:protein kinase domain-containing protein [Dyella subtropica]|uniref:class III lanthionine synthetase LanKC N-terminal domain-containing protein n=1 Tax=Dyella subtropica TaxID=2992127 RepID=UPI002255CEF4|nr:hypothetical protein [Dyella subtropica]